ncbi:MAG: FAA hydrolase family protein [Alphaproteobacteria bacterium]|nr:MAG: FAA hydrolase family protein [Alphaproteobacteria bacterium]
MSFCFEPGPVPSVLILGSENRFPVHRIYCVGRNYAAHAREMGGNPDREPPFFFAKPADAIVEDGADIPYPPQTDNLHHEVELVVALGRQGADIPVEAALDHIFGYAVGNDLTRRDLQADAKNRGQPWDAAKGFDHSAPIAAIHRVADVGHPSAGQIRLTVNGEIRQEGDLRDLIWSVPEVVSQLSRLFTLMPGDLIFTGTPAGVGPVRPGDVMEGSIDGLGSLKNRIV